MASQADHLPKILCSPASPPNPNPPQSAAATNWTTRGLQIPEHCVADLCQTVDLNTAGAMRPSPPRRREIAPADPPPHDRQPQDRRGTSIGKIMREVGVEIALIGHLDARLLFVRLLRRSREVR